MKRLIVLALVLALTSISSAALTWSVDSFNLFIPVGGSITIQLISDSSYAYANGPAWVGFEYGGDSLQIVSITARPAAGGNAEIKSPTETGYPGWWTVSALDFMQPFTIAAGTQWDVTIRCTGWTDIYALHSDYYSSAGPDDIISMPEPAIAALIALGGLFLRHRK